MNGAASATGRIRSSRGTSTGCPRISTGVAPGLPAEVAQRGRGEKGKSIASTCDMDARESVGKPWRGPGWYVSACEACVTQRTPLWRTENTRAHLSPPSGPTLPLESQVASTDSNTPPPYQFTKAICRPTA